MTGYLYRAMTLQFAAPLMAIAMLGAGDTLVVAGKGHENGQTAGGVTLPFSDHEEVRAALRERAA